MDVAPYPKEARALIEEAAVTAGREPAEVAVIYNFGGAITDTMQSPARKIVPAVREAIAPA